MSLLGKYLASLEEVEKYDIEEKLFSERGHDILLGPSIDPLEDIIEENDDVLDAYDRIDENDDMDDFDWVDSGKLNFAFVFSIPHRKTDLFILTFLLNFVFKFKVDKLLLPC